MFVIFPCGKQSQFNVEPVHFSSVLNCSVLAPLVPQAFGLTSNLTPLVRQEGSYWKIGSLETSLYTAL